MSEGVTVPIRVTPRASRNTVEGPGDDGILRVRVTAAPADGAANRAVQVLVAGALGVPKTRVSIVSGAASRHKHLRIQGLDSEAMVRCWPGISLGPQRPD